MTEPKKTRLTRPIKLIIILLFFIGPSYGIWRMFMGAHERIRNDAREPAIESILTVAEEWSEEEMRLISSGPLLQQFDFDKLDDYRATYGPLVEAGEPKAVDSGRFERRDQAWQFAVYEARCEFEKGEATLRVKMIRLYLEPPWKIEEFSVEPVQSGT